MKRFITYLYEYDRGHRLKNTGFIRVDERNGLVNMQLCVRNYIRAHEKGKVYVFVRKGRLVGMELGEVAVMNGQGDAQLRFDADDIMDSGCVLEDVVGIGIVFRSNGYLASCWKDEEAEAVAGGRYEMFSEENEWKPVEEVVISEKVSQETPVDAEILSPEAGVSEIIAQDSVPRLPELREQQLPEPARPEPAPRTDLVTYRKMELNHIRQLPSPNWYLCNNRFLVHGFFNYGYLVLKKEMEADSEAAFLGVPGVFEKPEMVMATLFGFPEFEALPLEVSAAQMGEILSLPGIEKSQEPKAGTFGCWLIPLK